MLRIALALAALVAAQPALAQGGDADPRPWSATAVIGTTTLEGEGGQPYASAALTRAFGDAYVRVAATVIDDADDAVRNGFQPARTYQLTLAGGVARGPLSIDGYGLLGVRDFERGAVTGQGGQAIDFESSGRTTGAGLTLTYDVALGENGLLSPFVSADYNSIDVARVATLPGGRLPSRKNKEDGVTGTAGATLQRLFGRHSVTVYGAFVATSNSASSSRGTAPAASTRVGRLLDTAGEKDEWAEYGAIGTVGLNDRLELDLSVVRTAGFAPGEATSFAAGVRLAF